MYATAATVLLAAITVLAGIAAVHAQAGGADMVANDDTAVSNGIDQLAIDILANDIFDGPVNVTLTPDYVDRHTARGVTRHHDTEIIEDVGSARYNGTHLVYAPGVFALSDRMILARYTYTIQDDMGRSDSANITINITRPVASAAVSDMRPDPTFLIAAYSTDPISGRILDDADNIIYNFAGIKSAAVDAVALDDAEDYWNSLQLRIFSPPVITEGIPDTLHGRSFDCDGNRVCTLSLITGIAPEFDTPLEPGTYTYQFARTVDVNYTGSDVYAGTFVVSDLPEPAAPIPDPQNRPPVAGDATANVMVYRADARYAIYGFTYVHNLVDDIYAAKTIQLPVSDPDGDDLTITSVTGATLGAVFDQYLSRNTVAYIAGSPGIDSITYTVSDGRGGTDTGTIYVYVNEPGNSRPYFDHEPIFIDAEIGQELGFDTVVIDSDYDPVAVKIINAPVDIVFHQTSVHYVPVSVATAAGSLHQARFIWTPAESQAGQHTFTVIAYDNRSGAAWQDVTITVLPEGAANPNRTEPNATITVPPRAANRNPIAPDIQISAVSPPFPTVIIPGTADPDGDETAITGAAGATLGAVSIIPRSTGIILYVPDQPGIDTITYTVRDSRGGTDNGTITIYIREQGNTIPVLGSIAGMGALETYMSRGLVVPTGIFRDSGDITRTIQAGAARQVSHNPAPGFLHASIIINMTDAGSPGAGLANYDIIGQNDTNILAVSINEMGNVPPVLLPMGDYTINAHDTLTFRVPATDSGAGTLSYTLSGAPDGATVYRQGSFSWTPGSQDVGNRTFTITVHDRHGYSDAESVTITVLPAGTPNEPPTAPDVAATVAPDGRAIIVPAISDPDGDPTRITAATGNAGGAIMPSGNNIEYIAGPDATTETITYTVRDSRGASAMGTITITIR